MFDLHGYGCCFIDRYLEFHYSSMSQEDLEHSRKVSSSSSIQGSRKWLVISALVYNMFTCSVSSSIRYGFLADAFASRGVSGKIYGMLEGSIFFGCLLTFFCGGAEWMMRRVGNARYLLSSTAAAFSVLSLLTGFFYLIPNNTTVIILSSVARVTYGTLVFACAMITYDFVHCQFCEEFDITLGLINMGTYCGHGVAQFFGCYLYEKFGYLQAFIFASAITCFSSFFTFFIIPNSEPSLGSENEAAAKGMSKYKISPILMLPFIVIMLVSVNYGALQVALTPFLHSEFNKSISYGGLAASSVSVGMALGSVLCGILLQKKFLHPCTIMMIGSFGVCLGLLVCFPQQNLAVYEIAPILAFPGALLAGLGDPLMGMAALKTMYHIQEKRTGQLTPTLTNRITSIWTISYFSFYYCGSILAGILTDFFSYSDTGLILAGMSFLAVLISLGLRIADNYIEERSTLTGKLLESPARTYT